MSSVVSCAVRSTCRFVARCLCRSSRVEALEAIIERNPFMNARESLLKNMKSLAEDFSVESNHTSVAGIDLFEAFYDSFEIDKANENLTKLLALKVQHPKVFLLLLLHNQKIFSFKNHSIPLVKITSDMLKIFETYKSILDCLGNELINDYLDSSFSINKEVAFDFHGWALCKRDPERQPHVSDYLDFSDVNSDFITFLSNLKHYKNSNFPYLVGLYKALPQRIDSMQTLLFLFCVNIHLYYIILD